MERKRDIEIGRLLLEACQEGMADSNMVVYRNVDVYNVFTFCGVPFDCIVVVDQWHKLVSIDYHPSFVFGDCPSFTSDDLQGIEV